MENNPLTTNQRLVRFYQSLELRSVPLTLHNYGFDCPTKFSGTTGVRLLPGDQLLPNLRGQASLSELSEPGNQKRICDYGVATTGANPTGCSDHPTKVTVSTNDRFVLRRHLDAIGTITAPHVHFPKNLSNAPLTEQFTENTVRWLQLSNTPYAGRDSVMTSYCDSSSKVCKLQHARKSLGVFYPEDYQTHELTKLSKSSLLGLHSLPKYFDKDNMNSFVASCNQRTPSESLNAFFHGPTIADCATTLLACQFRAIETIVGTDEFNRIFGAPVSTFRIARALFNGSIDSEYLTDVAKKCKPIDLTNPLYCLFEDLEITRALFAHRELLESDITEGDILYIQGVDSYTAKHKSGSSIGFNLICTGQNSHGQNLYLGFGPDEFAEPKTYDQVKNILIDGYNKPQSAETLAAIEAGETHYAQLTDHTVTYDHPIVGIIAALRFDLGFWEHFSSQYDEAWHQQPLLSVVPAVKPKPVDHGSPFPSENLGADFEHFEAASPQQEFMKQTALKFTHAVINNLAEEVSQKKPMGLFLSGSPGLGKTHLCVAAAKKAAEYSVDTLYIDAAKICGLIQDFAGDETQWGRKIDEMLAGKDLVVIDDANKKYGYTRMFLAKAMQHVMANNKAIMISSNNPVAIKAAAPGIIDPLTKGAHNFVCLGDLQGESYRSQWWQSTEVQATDALSQLGQYQGGKSAAVITEEAVSIDDVAKTLGISVDQIREVGSPCLPASQRRSPDYFFQELSKTEHSAVFMACPVTGDQYPYSSVRIEQFLNVVQKVHDEGLKLVIKTNNRQQFLKIVLDMLNDAHSLRLNKLRITDRLKHMFPDFS